MKFCYYFREKICFNMKLEFFSIYLFLKLITFACVY